MKFKCQNPKSKINSNIECQISKLMFCYLSFVILLTGCDAFVRKFTRKPKIDDTQKQELVLAPVEYTGSELSKEEQYRQALLFWKSWHDELIEVLSHPGANHKKQADCSQQAIKHLADMRALLSQEAQNKLDLYINQLGYLKNQIEKDIYGNNIASYSMDAERLRRGILRDFSYHKIKASIL